MSRLEEIGRQQGAYFTAAELVSTSFPDPRWAVPGLIAEGLTLLAGPPKLGKSWLVLGLGISTASGTPALGKIESAEGDVLYCALEDTPRRIKSRLSKMLGGKPQPGRLVIVTALPGMPQATELVSEWLDEHPDARLVVVDVLGKIRPPDGERANAYERDYAVIGQLKKLADHHRVAIVVVTHTRKMGADDAFDTVAGSTGLTGAADTTLVLKRARGEASAVLHVTGRDVEESEYALTFDPPTGSWTLDGNALAEAASRAGAFKASENLGEKAFAVIDYVAQHPAGVRSADVVAAVEGIDSTAARQLLKRAADAGRIAKIDRGLYAPTTSATSVTFTEDGERDTRSACDSATPQACEVCLEPMADLLDGATTHPTCEGGAL